MRPSPELNSRCARQTSKSSKYQWHTSEYAALGGRMLPCKVKEQPQHELRLHGSASTTHALNFSAQCARACRCCCAAGGPAPGPRHRAAGRAFRVPPRPTHPAGKRCVRGWPASARLEPACSVMVGEAVCGSHPTAVACKAARWVEQRGDSVVCQPAGTCRDACELHLPAHGRGAFIWLSLRRACIEAPAMMSATVLPHAPAGEPSLAGWQTCRLL